MSSVRDKSEICVVFRSNCVAYLFDFAQIYNKELLKFRVAGHTVLRTSDIVKLWMAELFLSPSPYVIWWLPSKCIHPMKCLRKLFNSLDVWRCENWQRALYITHGYSKLEEKADRPIIIHHAFLYSFGNWLRVQKLLKWRRVSLSLYRMRYIILLENTSQGSHET